MFEQHGTAVLEKVLHAALHEDCFSSQKLFLTFCAPPLKPVEDIEPDEGKEEFAKLVAGYIAFNPFVEPKNDTEEAV